MKNPAAPFIALIFGSGLFPLLVFGAVIDTTVKFSFRQLGNFLDWLPLPEHDYHGNLIEMVDSPRSSDHKHFQTIDRYLFSGKEKEAVYVNAYLAKAALYQRQLDDPLEMPLEMPANLITNREEVIRGVIEEKGKLILKAQGEAKKVTNTACRQEVKTVDQNSSIKDITRVMQICSGE